MKLITTIRFKMNLSVISQVLIITLIVTTLVLLKINIQRLSNTNDISAANNISIHSLVFGINSYFVDANDFKSVENNYNQVALSTIDSITSNYLSEIWLDVEQYDKINKDNSKLEKQVSLLIDSTISLSGNYIKKYNRSLSDSVKRLYISLQERKAINYANMLILANYKVHSEFNGLKNNSTEQEYFLNKLKTIIAESNSEIKTQRYSSINQLAQLKNKSTLHLYQLTEEYISNLIISEQINQHTTKKADELLISMYNNSLASTNKTVANTGKLISVLLYVLILISLLVIVLNGLTSVMVNLFTSRISYFLTEMGKGNLTQKIGKDVLTRNDEMGIVANVLNDTTIKLIETMQSIKAGADSIANVGKQLSSSSIQMSQGASEQASSIEEVSSSMEEMVSNIDQNSENAVQTQSIAKVSANGVTHIGNSSEDNLKAVRNIASKITIVNDIAFQTNLLALNAAVEAARAGEKGKGFAVVASEVRKLAERSKIAADEIDILSKTSVKSTEEAKGQIETIIPEIVRTSQLIEEIASASTEQRSGAAQINMALQQLNSVTQQNASSSEEIAGNAEELTTQADELNNLMTFFKLDGSKSTPKTTSKPTKSTNITSGSKKLQSSLKPNHQASPKPTRKLAETGVVFNLGEKINDEEFEHF